MANEAVTKMTAGDFVAACYLDTIYRHTRETSRKLKGDKQINFTVAHSQNHAASRILSFTVPSGVMISRPCHTYIVSIFSIQRDQCFLRDLIRSVLSDVHFVMLLLYDVFGLPRLRFPLTFPWITHFTSSHPPSLMVCPKKESLRRTTNPRSCLVVPTSVRMLSSVLCSVQLTRNIRR